MYYCFNELHPLWFEFIHLTPSPKEAFNIKRKKIRLRAKYRKIPIERHGDFATTHRQLFVQLNNFVVVIMQHWNPLPKWSLELLAAARKAG